MTNVSTNKCRHHNPTLQNGQTPKASGKFTITRNVTLQHPGHVTHRLWVKVNQIRGQVQREGHRKGAYKVIASEETAVLIQCSFLRVMKVNRKERVK